MACAEEIGFPVLFQSLVSVVLMDFCHGKGDREVGLFVTEAFPLDLTSSLVGVR